MTGECETVPGKTMPHLKVVERDYANLQHRFCSLGPRLKEDGVEDHGIHIRSRTSTTGLRLGPGL